ncbi:unnamed protein product [Ilex paraguariensis]|uniref:S-type anion channel n=1 Tax=Ilex paraguariensis TaxID=185542 RepID=A0ABC8SLB3_9AQUA
MQLFDKETQGPQPHIELVIDANSSMSIIPSQTHSISIMIKGLTLPILTRFHAGYFRISLSLCSQALLWKTLGEPSDDAHAFRRILRMLPSTAFVLLWSLALFTLVSLSLLYILRCLLHFDMVKNEFFHHVGVNYLFAPWISWLLLLQSAPFFTPKTMYYLVLWWLFVAPIIVLDVKIYGQWFIKGKRFLSTVANPTSQLSVIGNLVGAWAAARMGWRESAICLFSLGMAHYLVLFVTLYQRLSENEGLPAMLRPVFFLFFAAPSMASLAWDSITGSFDNSSKMLFFLSLFLFLSLSPMVQLKLAVVFNKKSLDSDHLDYKYSSWTCAFGLVQVTSMVFRPALFKKSMRKFNVVWWAYSFPLTVLALASTEYAQEVKSGVAHGLMLVLSTLSVVVSLFLMVFTALNTNCLLPSDDPMLSPGGSSPVP